LHRLARGEDDRPVLPDRETKSVSVEDTFEIDVTDPALLGATVERMADRVAERLRASSLSGRTVTLKVRHHDFSTLTRSQTLAGPTDDRRVITRVARGLFAEIDTSDGVRLLGVGVHGLADWVQDDLFTEEEASEADAPAEPATSQPVTAPQWHPGGDVEHDDHGRGWVWGAGLGRVTVRFETRDSPIGPVRTFAADDPRLRRCPPRALPSSSMTELSPPIARRVPSERTHQGTPSSMRYEWLRDKEDPEVVAYLEAENAYAAQQTEHLEPLRQRIFDEIKSRTLETDLSVPSRKGDWWYYGRTIRRQAVRRALPLPDRAPLTTGLLRSWTRRLQCRARRSCSTATWKPKGMTSSRSAPCPSAPDGNLPCVVGRLPAAMSVTRCASRTCAPVTCLMTRCPTRSRQRRGWPMPVRSST
jgi:hypothetical protein